MISQFGKSNSVEIEGSPIDPWLWSNNYLSHVDSIIEPIPSQPVTVDVGVR